MRHSNTTCDFASSDSWVILSPIEQSIKRKIEAVGTPLKDWDIQINYGIKTGYNDAFIIDTAKRDEILANCKTEEERKRTAELIRPILRGRNIKRYCYDWADLWLIATFPARHYDIEQYPAVKKYLLSFGKERLEQTGKTYTVNGEKIKARKKTNNKWFETQDSISYWEDFSSPKIMWAETMRIRRSNDERFPRFSFEQNEKLTDKTCFIATGEEEELKYVLALLNSFTGRYQLHHIVSKMDDGGWLMQKIYLQQVRIPSARKTVSIKASKLVNELLLCPNNENVEVQIDKLIEDAFGLSEEEVEYIHNYLNKPLTRLSL